jgi:hypothetical protein
MYDNIRTRRSDARALRRARRHIPPFLIFSEKCFDRPPAHGFVGSVGHWKSNENKLAEYEDVLLRTAPVRKRYALCVEHRSCRGNSEKKAACVREKSFCRLGNEDLSWFQLYALGLPLRQSNPFVCSFVVCW